MATEQVWAVSMMKNEEDIAYSSVCHMAEEAFDGVIVMDNGSTDGTLKALRQIEKDSLGLVQVREDWDVPYYQSRKMTYLAEQAREQGATWVVPFDADEIWVCHLDALGNYLRSLPPEALCVEVPLYNHFRTAFDLGGGSPFEQMVYRQPDAGALPKVAFRPWGDFVLEAGNHSVTLGGKSLPLFGVPERCIEIRHFPYRSLEQFISKAVPGGQGYAQTDLPEDMGAHWREYYRIWQRGGEGALQEVYERWFYFPAPVTQGLVLDPAPFRRWNQTH